MQHVPLVSVVLPVFNAEPYVRDALHSVLGQTLADFEVIAIDDGSTDASGRILAALAGMDARVRHVSRGNRGLTHTLNEGLEAARAPYVAIMNADDVALPDRLRLQAAFLDAHPRVAAVGGQVTLMLADGTPGPATSLPCDPAAVRRFLDTMSPFAHPAVMLRRQDVLAVGGYRAQIEPAEDYDLWLRLAERFDLANLPNVLLRYRLHAGQATAARFESVAVATLIAQAAARMRRAGGADPLDGRSPLDRSHAEQLGISPSAIATRAIEAALGRSESLLACGASAAVARQPLESLAQGTAAAAAPVFFRAASRWLDGRVLAREGRFVAAASALVAAAAAAPYFRARLGRAVSRRMAALCGGGLA